MKINLNKVAVSVSIAEGGKVNLPVAQLKEVIRCYNAELKKFKISEVVEVLERE